MALSVHCMAPEARAKIRHLARSRTAPARTVQRACIVWLASQGHKVPAIAAELSLCPATVRTWLKHFNCQGPAGLEERPRPGRPAQYTPDQVSTVIATSLTNPRELGLPFASWTLDRLQAYLHEVKRLPMKRSRVDELLLAKGLRWRQQETWFGERVDPAFAEKRGHHDALYDPAARQRRSLSG